MKAGTEVRDEVWSFVWDASMFQYACPAMTLSHERQPVCQPQPVYPMVLCAILNVKRRSCEEQAVKLREALNEKIDGVFHSRLPLSSLFLCCLYFHLAPQKKLLAFEHGRNRYKLRWATLDWTCRDIYLWVQSLNPPFRPLCLILGRIQQCSPCEYLVERNHRRKSFPKSQAAYGQRCNPKGWNSTRRNTRRKIDMVAAVFGFSKITVSFKEIASRFFQCWWGKYCRYTGEYFE